MPLQFESNMTPTFVAEPDMRFGTTFLSTKYRRYGVKGESFMDKESGEIFIKKPSDGKVVSFYQNKKYINDLVLELKVLLTNNENMTYPRESEEAYFLSTNYDLVTINREDIYNIINDNIDLHGNETSTEDLYKLRFKLSKESNGFFVRVNTRDCDKALVEYLTNEYNRYFENYIGANPEFVKQKRKFEELKWKDSNATLVYKVVATKGDKIVTFDCTDYIRLNESVSVYLPHTDIDAAFPNGVDNYEIQLISITFDKVQYMLHSSSTFENFDTLKFQEGVTKFINSDDEIQVQTMNVMHFIDTAHDFIVLGNETIIGVADIPYIMRHMSKLAKMKNSSQFILSIKRPDFMDWSINTLWAEELREVLEQGEEVINNTETTFQSLQNYLAVQSIIEGEITTDQTLIKDYLLVDF